MVQIIKSGTIKVPTQPKDFDLKATGLVFKSYDNQVALEFNVEKQDGTPADLLGANLRLLMFIYDEIDGTVTKEPIPFITKNLITESFLNGHVVYILPEAMKAYNGMVETYVYIEYSDGSTSDNLGFTFRMQRSKIDGLAQDKADYFITDFQQLLDAVKQKAADAVNETLAKVEASSTKMQELEQRIDEQTEIFNNADVYNKAEIEDKLKPFALRTDIDSLSIEKADKTFVDAQLAETMKTGKPTIGYAGVIRRDATGWFYIEDAVHEKVNMLTVSETANNEIEVTYTDAGKVGSMIVAPDETLASLGVIAGASVGDYRAYIKCYAPFVGYISSNGTVVNTNALFTDTATSVVSVDKTKMTVAYDGAGNGLDKTLVSPVNDNAAPFTGVDYHTSRTGAGTVEVRAFHPLYANVAFDGTNWVVTTKCVANITAAWDGSTNELVITHDGMPSGAGYTQFMDVALTMRKSTSGALIHGRVTSVNTTQIRIEFYNAAGTKLTAASNEMRLYISRPGFKVPHEIPPGARIYFDFGYSIVRPSKLQIPFSNLWILGVHNG
ncbi:BppU family phage baseplate upper protein [Enterococcus faecium]|uniref:BppU family phage baseplate upper protein n=1 Tax=Enterococcus faecium TaxID=1352 RepID=UPI00403C3066